MAHRGKVGLTMFCKDMEPEIFKIPVAKSPTNNVPDGSVQSFDEPIRDFVYEVVQNLSPPVL